METFASIPVWSRSLEQLVQDSLALNKHLALFTDCTGLDAPGRALQLCKWASCAHWSGSEASVRVRALLEASGPLQVSQDMCEHDFSERVKLVRSQRTSGLSIYVAGTPCQGFSLRNTKRKQWGDSRSKLLGDALDKARVSGVDAALLENSHMVLYDLRPGHTIRVHVKLCAGIS